MSAEKSRRPDAHEPLPVAIGRHEVIRRLGAGGSGDVFLARTRGPCGFTRLVAIKRLRPANLGDPACVAELAREALAYARLAHPAIVQLYDVVEHEGSPALVLEYVDGLSLHQLRQRLSRRREALGDDCAMYVMHHVFAALAAAHEARAPETGEPAQVIHRDVTPANVLLDWYGAVRLTDFGLARVGPVESSTAGGLVKGTLGYMAPEQVRGAATSARTDVYLGCLLLRELLLRRKTFDPAQASEIDLMDGMENAVLPPIEHMRTGVPRAVCAALRLGLRRDPSERAVRAAEIRDVLAAEIDLDAAQARLAGILGDVRTNRAPLAGVQAMTTRQHVGVTPIATPLSSDAPPRAVWSAAPHELPARTPPSRGRPWALAALAAFSLVAGAFLLLLTARSAQAFGQKLPLARKAEVARRSAPPAAPARLGARGVLQAVDVPCGGHATLSSPW